MPRDGEALRARKVTREEWDRFAVLARLGRPGDGLRRCVQSAYLTMNRTLVGMVKSLDADGWRRQMTECLEERLVALTGRAAWSQDEFDAWHRGATHDLIKTAADLHFSLTVGQAQKWINMSVKNGMALGDRLNPSLFCVYDLAHVALDRVVITGLRQYEWMPRDLLQDPWSKLEDYGEYMKCQCLIRENLPGIPIEEEFRLWQKGRTGVGTTVTCAAETEASHGLHAPNSSLVSQVVGNAGLYFVCYKLSLQGWNVMPTARNARGIDIIAYSRDAKVKIAVQVKALGKRNPVPVGGSLDGIMGDFWVIVDRIRTDQPRAFILLPSEVREMAHRNKSGETASYWLEPPMYDQEAFREAWERIGRGDAPDGD